MNKKEERLSPIAKRLLDGARKRGGNGASAVKYLESVPPEKLNHYDRRKIGREILARIGRSTYRGYEPLGIKKAYGLQEPHVRYSSMSDGGVDGTWTAEANRYEKIAKKEIKKKEFGHAVLDYDKIGAYRLRDGDFDGSVKAYRKALVVLPKVNKDDYVSLCLPDLADRLKKNIGVVRMLQDEESRKGEAERTKQERLSHTGFHGNGINFLIAIAGVLGGIFFLSTNITGNAIADLTTKTTSFLGAGLLIVGLVAGFFWVKGRKSN